MKNFKLNIFLLLVVILFAQCKKDSALNPVNKTGVGLYNWFTSPNTANSTYWVRNNDNYVWTFYASGYGTAGKNTFKVFNDQNKYVNEYSVSFANLYPQGVNGWDAYYCYFTNKTNGNIENAYLSHTNLGADPSWKYTFLHTNQIDKTGNVVNNDSVFVHYSYSCYISSNFKFTKTSSNYFFAYDLKVRDSCVACGNKYFKDSLILIKTDLNLNILSRMERVNAPDSINNNYGGTIYDLKSDGNNLFLTFIDATNSSLSTFETFDNNLNSIHFVTINDINSNYYSTYNSLQSIYIASNKVMVFGDVINNSDYKSNTLLVSFFDLSGNLLKYRELKHNKPFGRFKGVEPTPDNKLILYYDETYEQYSNSVGYMGITKIDFDANIDFQFIFPENEASGYQACYAYENSDGTLNLFAKKNVPNNTGGQQTIVVKVDKTGKLQ